MTTSQPEVRVQAPRFRLYRQRHERTAGLADRKAAFIDRNYRTNRPRWKDGCSCRTEQKSLSGATFTTPLWKHHCCTTTFTAHNHTRTIHGG